VYSTISHTISASFCLILLHLLQALSLPIFWFLAIFANNLTLYSYTCFESHFAVLHLPQFPHFALNCLAVKAFFSLTSSFLLILILARVFQISSPTSLLHLNRQWVNSFPHSLLYQNHLEHIVPYHVVQYLHHELLIRNISTHNS
jgi:hypothetical protein